MTIAFVLGLYASIRAFGGSLSIASIAVVYLAGLSSWFGGADARRPRRGRGCAVRGPDRCGTARLNGGVLRAAVPAGHLLVARPARVAVLQRAPTPRRHLAGPQHAVPFEVIAYTRSLRTMLVVQNAYRLIVARIASERIGARTDITARPRPQIDPVTSPAASTQATLADRECRARANRHSSGRRVPSMPGSRLRLQLGRRDTAIEYGVAPCSARCVRRAASRRRSERPGAAPVAGARSDGRDRPRRRGKWRLGRRIARVRPVATRTGPCASHE